MRTIYYKTSNYIEHTGNLVDLEEFRRRQALAREDSRPEGALPEEEPGAYPPPAPRAGRRSAWERRAWTLDACASLAVVVMTLLVALRVML